MKRSMSIYECACIASRNLRRKKRKTIRIFLNLLLMFSSVMIWIVLLSALSAAHDQYLYGASSQNELLFRVNVGPAGLNSGDHQADQVHALAHLQKMKETGKAAARCDLNLLCYLQKESWSFVNIKYTSAEIEGRQYQGINDHSYYFEKEYDRNEMEYQYTVPFRVQAAFTTLFYTENELIEYTAQTGRETPVLAGTAEVYDNQLLITDYMLEKYGITSDYDLLIGKQISFYCESTPILKSFTIAGILDNRLFKVGALRHSSQIIIRGNNDLISSFQITETMYYLPICGYDQSEAVLDEIERMDNYAAGLLLEFAVRYYSFIADLQFIIRRISIVFGIPVLLALILMFYHTFSQYHEKQLPYYGMMKAIGMQSAEISWILCLEMLFLLTAAGFLSFWIASCVLRLTSNALLSFIGIELSLNAGQAIWVIFASSMILLFIAVLVLLLNLWRLYQHTPAELLHS